ncbi:MAG: phosphoribosylamine--glycine ligase [Acidimicrobiales bacterium]
MTVCVVGTGAREHALAVALARHDRVVVTPGNPGMTARIDGEPISVSAAPPEEIDADLVVVGPESALVDGLADKLRAMGRRVFGPGAKGARLEGSKAFMKEILAEAGVITARHGVFDEPEAARKFLGQLPGPFVVKTDGLAGGKGVLVTQSRADALADVEAKLSGAAFGEAGRRVVIEEGLFGVECSVHVLCDGRTAVPLPCARDYKRVHDADEGPNTGGMGAVAPCAYPADAELVSQVLERAVQPVLGALRRRGIEYRGVLYAGIMVTVDGPAVLELNVRFGDPETQVILPLIDDDLKKVLCDTADGCLQEAPRAASASAVCVVAAAPGYPGHPTLGQPIGGLRPDGQLAQPVEGAYVLHAGTAVTPEGGFSVAGGRVLSLVGLGSEPSVARDRAYRALGRVGWEGLQARGDIAAGQDGGPVR